MSGSECYPDLILYNIVLCYFLTHVLTAQRTHSCLWGGNIQATVSWFLPAQCMDNGQQSTKEENTLKYHVILFLCVCMSLYGCVYALVPFLLPRQNIMTTATYKREQLHWGSQFQRIRVPGHHGWEHGGRQTGMPPARWQRHCIWWGPLRSNLPPPTRPHLLQ